MTAHNLQLDKERLLQLSDEVSRIAASLAKLSTDSDPVAREEVSSEHGPVPNISPDAVAWVIKARRLRSVFFEQELFADPAWDMMLELLHAELTHRRVQVSTLCTAAGVAPTTALRWLKTLVDKDLVVRRDDPFDGRRVYVELKSETSNALKRLFGKLAISTTN